MVHGSPWRLRCGTLLAFTFACALAPVQAQNLFEQAQNLFGVGPEPEHASAPANGTLLGNQQRTRFVIGLPKATNFEVFSLSNPNRVIVQLAETKLRLPEQPKAAPIGLIKSFQAGLSGDDRSRVIIYVTEPVIVSSARIEKTQDGRGQHLAVEIVPFVPVTASIAAPVKDEVKAMDPPPFALGGAGLQPPLPRPAISPDVLAQRAFKPVIVIDPGHGGHNSGAEKNGLVEKDVVLAFGKILAAKLKATGRFKVEMTRDTDVFIPLGERVAFAEEHKSNLYISVHCDYADTGSAANGATIYSLRDSVADSLRRSTRGEVASNVLSKNEVEKVKQASGGGGDVDLVKGILADLAEREVDVTSGRTSVFARTVIKTMGASTAMRNDPDQQASFRVLKTAQFPAVLIELAYVTNKQDAENLQSDAWRDKVTNSILNAIDNYFSNQMAQLPM